jgi:myo-inositol-1(or 4)-monophosphatase
VLDSCAGQVLWGGFGRRHKISYKGEADLVTEANEEAKRKIKEILRETFPNHGMLTEEGGETDGQSEARHTASRQL